jgi:outer membrane receptor protein involved in Fe transport
MENPSMNHRTRPFVRALRSLAAVGAAAAAASLLPAVSAQVASSAVDPRTLAKYDKNGNGLLDPAERAALQADEAKAAAAVKAASASPAADDKVIELSPFQVTASEDKGYLAANTLSGTRLNSKIEDLGASITVVTKQQLLDTAAVDINDVFLYEANTEGTGTYTAFSVDRNGGVNDSVQGSPATANRIRGIDSANTSRGNFASNSSIPMDAYNVDAVEISRGPNSNIFGLGNTSGTVNIINSQANLTRQITSAMLRADSYGGYRTSFDVNRPIFAQKLAVRLSGVYESKAFQRKPSDEITRRGQAAVTYRPFSTTTIRGTYESYHNYARRPNSVTPRDAVSYWKAVGSPTWDPTTQIATYANGTRMGPYTQAQDGILPIGLLSNGTGFYNRPSIYVDGGAVQFWSVNRTGSVPTTGTFAGIPTPDNPNTNLRFLESGTDIQRQRSALFPLYVMTSITDQSLYDWTSVNFVAPNYNKDKADIYTVEFEQIAFQNQNHLLAFRGGWMREDHDNYSRNFIGGTNAVLYVDVNEKLLDGRANPYFKRPYVAASEPTMSNRPTINDTQSADLAYQLTPSGLPRLLSWIGKQSVAGHAEVRRIDTATYRYRDAVLSDHTWINLQNRTGVTAARAYYKYYVGDAQGSNIDYAPADIYGLSGKHNLTWFNAATNQWVNEAATIGETGVTPSDRVRREIRTQSATAQSFFFGNRLVTTFGLREDTNRSRNSNGAVIDAGTGLIDYSPLRVWGPWLEKSGKTKTAGGVIRPLRDVGFVDRAASEGSGLGRFLAQTARSASFHLNRSDSFQPAVTQYNLKGEPLPNPTGRGKDFGVSFSLFDNKLYVRLNRYENFQQNARNGDAGIVATRAIRLDTGRSGNGNDSFDFEEWATNLANARFTAQGVTPTAAQTSSAVAKIMGLEEGYIDTLVGKSITETSDIEAKGMELEVNYNPNRNWRFKVTGAQQKAIDTNISPGVQEYIDRRMPVWTSVMDDAGLNWWTTRLGSGGVPRDFFIGSVQAPLKLAIANQGKPRSQVREWRFNTLMNYTITEGKFRGATLGGAVRWEDKASIGFRGAAPEADGVVRSLDKTRPIYDQTRFYVDLSAGYQLRLFSNKVRTRVQLNVRNALEGGRLQAVAVNPDGAPYAYRIIDPRQFILTTTFDL